MKKVVAGRKKLTELNLTSQAADPLADFFNNASSSWLELSTHAFRSQSHLKPGSNNATSKAAVATSFEATTHHFSIDTKHVLQVRP